MADKYRGFYPDAENFLDSLNPEAPLNYSDIEGISLSYENDNWVIAVYSREHGEYDYTVNLGADLPDWIWDELYYLADIYDWDWETSYE